VKVIGVLADESAIQTLNVACTGSITGLDKKATVCKAQKWELKQPQTPILFWPPNISAMVVKS